MNDIKNSRPTSCKHNGSIVLITVGWAEYTMNCPSAVPTCSNTKFNLQLRPATLVDKIKCSTYCIEVLTRKRHRWHSRTKTENCFVSLMTHRDEPGRTLPLISRVISGGRDMHLSIANGIVELSWGAASPLLSKRSLHLKMR